MKKRHSRYRSAALLAGMVCLGWVWDFALGGGRVHAAAWLAALVVVPGISLLAAHAAEQRADEPELRAPQRPEPARAITIRPAVDSDFPALIEVEVAADRLFEVAGYGETPGPASIGELADARLLLVAVPTMRQPSAREQPPVEQPPVGYLRVELVDGQPHLEGLSVRPIWMRKGIGTALVSAACDWAVEQGFNTMTLCTFADVPWNGPFYARLGFREEPVLTPQLQELRRREEHAGLDQMGRRWVMRKPLASGSASD